MLEKSPEKFELAELMGDAGFAAWNAVTEYIEEMYLMDVLWNTGGKAGPYECKFRRGGKTLCSLYPRIGNFGFMVIFGGVEREAFAAVRDAFSPEVLKVYDAAKTYHDGKWVMLNISDGSLFSDMQRMLLLKRRPNRKPA
ncbi:MAG: DUF3788 domain-containing protein [Methanocalculaceae archaeon]|jgi:hypothetical protein|nr:DUF3788 domain-containing protein [Methanocalculaceae archaeon]